MNNENSNKKNMYMELPTVPPENPEQRDAYIDPVTKHVWSYWNKKWADKGNTEEYYTWLKTVKTIKKSTSKIKSKPKIDLKVDSDELIIKDENIKSESSSFNEIPIDEQNEIKSSIFPDPEEVPPDGPPLKTEETSVDEQDKTKPPLLSETEESPPLKTEETSLESNIDNSIPNELLTNEDKEIREFIKKQELKEYITQQKQLNLPDPKLVQGNQFYFVIDITSPQEGNKVSFDFADYLSRYFVGATIYLIGLDNNYTLDHFRKKKPNLIYLKPKTKKILNSYIAFSRRFYTFSQAYAKWAIEQNINSCTLFLPKGKTSIKMEGLDICEVEGDVILEVVGENRGNVLTYPK